MLQKLGSATLTREPRSEWGSRLRDQTVAVMDMPSGRFKFFNTDRGYGFIAPDDGGSDFFVHVHDVEAAGMNILVAGQLVAYEVGPRRMAAQRPSIFARLTSVRNASLPSPALREMLPWRSRASRRIGWNHVCGSRSGAVVSRWHWATSYSPLSSALVQLATIEANRGVFLESLPPVPAGGRDRGRYGQCPRPL